jgi:hypothetical protein
MVMGVGSLPAFLEWDTWMEEGKTNPLKDVQN